MCISYINVYMLPALCGAQPPSLPEPEQSSASSGLVIMWETPNSRN